jgi:hypothetical protein
MIDILSFLNTADKIPRSLTIPEYITLTKDIILAISALAAAIIAWRGLATWKKELKGKSEYEIAKQVLKSVYKVREAFKIARNPGISYDNPRSGIQDYENSNHILAVFNSFEETFKTIEERYLDAQIEWGDEFKDTINPLRECRFEFLKNIFLFYDYKKFPESQNLSKEQLSEIRSIIFSNIGIPDSFEDKINKAIEMFEIKLRPHIGGKKQ